LAEEFVIAGERNAGEIEFEIFDVAVAVGGGVEYGVDVIKYCFWCG
jgi:hypothetical protein